jgi:tRNA1Val (adenine37-N6)-methyltransferase
MTLSDKGARENTTMFEGRVQVIQPVRGYRYAVDSLLLSHFVLGRARTSGDFVDLGAGSGVVSALLALAGRRPGLAIEYQPPLQECCRATIEANGLCHAVSCVAGDIRRLDEISGGGQHQLVVSNPPFFPAGSGRLSPDSMVAHAKHELACTMSDVISGARFLLPVGGRLMLIYPAPRVTQLVANLAKHKFELVALQSVHPREDSEACNVLVEAVKSQSRECRILPPIVVHADSGGYADWYDELKRAVLHQPC